MNLYIEISIPVFPHANFLSFDMQFVSGYSCYFLIFTFGILHAVAVIHSF